MKTPDKHIPERKCIGCGKIRPKRELIRFARQADGTFREDRTGTSGGRGAYLCGEASCLEKAKKRKSIRFSDYA